jgi:hypothetical protein
MNTIVKRSFRTLLTNFITCFAAILFSSASQIKKSDERPLIIRYVLVCHQGKTIRVKESEVRAHLAHGDGLGRCAEPILIKQD